MKCHIPEISWHNREPVLSVDFQFVNGEIRRLATSGTDCHILIWHIKTILDDSSTVDVEFAADLTRHDQSVNVVRFSPTGDYLASGDDDGHIFIWKKIDKPPNNAPNIFKDADVENKENWIFTSALRGHVKDVYDLCWSSDGKQLISGSVDNSAIMWDVHKGKNIGILSDHKGFVQGVAWDPLNQLIATLCSDRCCRVFNVATGKVLHRIFKANLKEPLETDASTSTSRPTRLFHDDTLKSFSRRLAFSPDGELLIIPTGIVESENDNHVNVTYIFSRHNLTKPLLYLPTMENYTTVVKCCPILFKLRSNSHGTPVLNDPEAKPWEVETTLFKLPYRIVFAVATQTSVIFYDTQQRIPFGRVSNIHFTGLTDMSWSSDGRILIISSSDGYCSFVTFQENEIGVPYDEDSSKYLPKEEVITPSNKVISPVNEKKQKQKSPQLITTVAKPSVPEPIPVAKKRISLITLFSPKLKSTIQVTTKNVNKDESTSACLENKIIKVDSVVPPDNADDGSVEIIYEKEENKSLNEDVKEDYKPQSNTLKNYFTSKLTVKKVLDSIEKEDMEIEGNNDKNEPDKNRSLESPLLKLDSCKIANKIDQDDSNKTEKSATNVTKVETMLSNVKTVEECKEHKGKNCTSPEPMEIDDDESDLRAINESHSEDNKKANISLPKKASDAELKDKEVTNELKYKIVSKLVESNVFQVKDEKLSPLSENSEERANFKSKDEESSSTNKGSVDSTEPEVVNTSFLNFNDDKNPLLQDNTAKMSPLKMNKLQPSYTSPSANKAPRRVQLITLSTPPKT